MIESGAAKLIDTLNSEVTPQKEFTEKNLRFDVPSQELTGDYNTKMVVSGVPGKGYYGSVELKYKRVPLTVIGDGIVIRKEGFLNLQEICDVLNSSRNTFLSLDDLVPVNIPNMEPGDTFVVRLTASPTSVAWTGEQDITIAYGKPTLRDMVGRTLLTAITPPGEKYDYPAAWALLYYQDFTAFRDSLAIDPKTGRFVDATAIHEVTRKLGIPSWAEQWPGDFATSAVPGSNQAFDRVVVQNYVGSGQMYGPIYFHYNTVKFDGV